jgi:hypothetical protein
MRDVGSPGGEAALAGTLDDPARRRFTEPFRVAGALRAAEGGKTFRADELTIREFHRSEGISDPDDMSIVYAIESRDRTRRTLVDAFGVYSNPAVSAGLAGFPFAGGPSIPAGRRP